MTASTDINVRAADWEQDAAALEALRTAVFVEEQGVPRDIEWDGRDSEARHVIAEDAGGVIGCGRILPDGRIGRLAVQAGRRSGGIGRQLLDALLDVAHSRGLISVYLHAQVSALAFYERAGFVADGEEFLEGGIAHRNMTQRLDYRDWDRDVFPVTFPTPFDQLAVAQARLCRRELAILSPTLDRRVFSTEDLASGIRALLRRGRPCRARILIQDSRPLAQQGHLLLELARRVPSSMELRKLPEHPDWNGDTLVLRDRGAVLAFPGGDSNPGSYRPTDRARCETALARFEELWNAGAHDPELRSLSL
jgi:predicted GNAT family N-acyltransferase